MGSRGIHSRRGHKLYTEAGREVQCSEIKGTAHVNISRDEHNRCDRVHDEHANHRHRHLHSIPDPHDTQLPRMFVVTIVSYEIDVKAMPVEDAGFTYWL
jgi:hypothetical protein